MKELERALEVFHEIEHQAELHRGSRIHPLSRLLVTVCYTMLTLSFGKYAPGPLICMVIYPLLMSIWEDIPVLSVLRRSRLLLLSLLVFGLSGLLFDAEVIPVGGVLVRGGLIAALTLILKGVLTISAVYILIAETGIEGVCLSLRRLHFPEMLTTAVLLSYRYLTLFMIEARNMMTAYFLRAPGRKGIAVQDFGSFAGLLLLRSLDRAQDVYDSMCLRGYDGHFGYMDERTSQGGRFSAAGSIAYTAVWDMAFLCLRYLPVTEWLGGLFV